MGLFAVALLQKNAFVISERLCCHKVRKEVRSSIAMKTPSFSLEGKWEILVPNVVMWFQNY